MSPTEPIEGTSWTPAVSPDLMDGRCTGKSKQSGERCRNHPRPGSNVCHIHGAKAPQVRAKAEGRVKEQKARELLASLGVPVRTDPITALQVCLDEAGGNLNALRAVVRERTRAADADPSDPVTRLYLDERDRLHRVAKDSVALGIELRRSELEREEVAAVVAVWKDVLADPSIGLTAEQGVAIRRGVGASLRELKHVETREMAGLAR